MSKAMFLVAVAATVAFFDTSALAQYRRDRGPDTKALVRCPANTCGPIGRGFATAVNLCSAANCNKSK
jgi:hypothetical protein